MPDRAAGRHRSRAAAHQAPSRDGDGTLPHQRQKIFITAGEHDLTENIVHLVLARLPDAPAGTSGISLFVVPKCAVDADGTLGDATASAAPRIEHKMGIRGSATCA